MEITNKKCGDHRIVQSRRAFLKASALCIGAALVAPGRVLAAGQEKTLHLHNLHSGEQLRTIFWANGTFVPESMDEINRILRDNHNGSEIRMDPAALLLVHDLAQAVDFRRPIEIVCGYRSAETNALLAREGHAVAKHSYHIKGQAIDLRMPGRDLVHLRTAAMDLRRGGVGYYPVSQFLHVDTGPIRQWAGV